jgi:hypothetical protein
MASLELLHRDVRHEQLRQLKRGTSAAPSTNRKKLRIGLAAERLWRCVGWDTRTGSDFGPTDIHVLTVGARREARQQVRSDGISERELLARLVWVEEDLQFTCIDACVHGRGGNRVGWGKGRGGDGSL